LRAGEKRHSPCARDSHSVTEDDPFEFGYLLTAVLNDTGTAGGRVFTVTFVNAYVETVRRTIRGEKTWKLDGAPASLLPESITVLRVDSGPVCGSRAGGHRPCLGQSALQPDPLQKGRDTGLRGLAAGGRRRWRARPAAGELRR